jgi:hypothetical protein
MLIAVTNNIYPNVIMTETLITQVLNLRKIYPDFRCMNAQKS